jgi:hypothetical protein
MVAELADAANSKDLVLPSLLLSVTYNLQLFFAYEVLWGTVRSREGRIFPNSYSVRRYPIFLPTNDDVVHLLGEAAYAALGSFQNAHLIRAVNIQERSINFINCEPTPCRHRAPLRRGASAR